MKVKRHRPSYILKLVKVKTTSKILWKILTAECTNVTNVCKSLLVWNLLHNFKWLIVFFKHSLYCSYYSLGFAVELYITLP